MMKWGLGFVGLAVAGLIAYTALGLGGAAAQTPTPTPEDQQDEDQQDEDQNWGERYQELLAEELGISVDELQDAQSSAWDKLIDERVAAGDITTERGEELKEMEPGEGPHLGKLPGGGPGLHLRVGAIEIFETAAEVVGIPSDELRERIGNGESLVDIAAEQGMDEDELRSQLETAFTDRINQAVEDGDIDQEMADNLLENLDRLIDLGINVELPFGGDIFEHLPDGMGPWEKGGLFHN